MQRHVRQVIRGKRSWEPEYKAGGSSEANSNLPPEAIRYGAGKQHGHEHPAVVNRPD